MDKEFLASEARRLSEEPLFKAALEALERKAYEELLRVSPWNPFANIKRRVLIERIKVIRDISGELRSIIAMGKAGSRSVA